MWMWKKACKICWFSGGRKASNNGEFVCADICGLLQAKGLRVLKSGGGEGL